MRAVLSRAAALLLAALLIMSAGVCASADYEAAEAKIPIGGTGTFLIKDSEAENKDAFDMVKIEGSGSFTLSFVEPDDYSYVVFSTDQDNPARYNVLVRVLVEGEQLLPYVVVTEAESGRKVPAALYPITVDPPVSKRVTGENIPKDESFHFLFKAISTSAEGLDGKLPMPEGSEGQVKRLTVVGSGETEAGEIRIDRAGTYVYEFSEVDDGVPGYSYDKSVFRVTFKVTESETGFQVDEQWTRDGIRINTPLAAFVNAYRTPISPKTGDTANPLLWGVILGGSLLLLSAVVWTLKKKNAGDWTEI